MQYCSAIQFWASQCKFVFVFCCLREFYDPGALIMEEEGVVIVGMLVGLNVIDANLCVKGEDLDSQVKHIAIQTMLSDDTDAKHCVFVSAGGRH